MCPSTLPSKAPKTSKRSESPKHSESAPVKDPLRELANRSPNGDDHYSHFALTVNGPNLSHITMYLIALNSSLSTCFLPTHLALR